MVLCGCECVERSDPRGFLTFLDRKVFTEAAGDGELSIHYREHSAQEEQIPDVRRLDVSSQWSRGRGQRDSEFVKARTGTALITIWRQHVLLHRFECFRHLPWAPIANRIKHPRFRRLEPIVEYDEAFSETHDRRCHEWACQPR